MTLSLPLTQSSSSSWRSYLIGPTLTCQRQDPRDWTKKPFVLSMRPPFRTKMVKINLSRNIPEVSWQYERRLQCPWTFWYQPWCRSSRTGPELASPGWRQCRYLPLWRLQLPRGSLQSLSHILTLLGLSLFHLQRDGTCQHQRQPWCCPKVRRREAGSRSLAPSAPPLWSRTWAAALSALEQLTYLRCFVSTWAIVVSATYFVKACWLGSLQFWHWK